MDRRHRPGILSVVSCIWWDRKPVEFEASKIKAFTWTILDSSQHYCLWNAVGLEYIHVFRTFLLITKCTNYRFITIGSFPEFQYLS